MKTKMIAAPVALAGLVLAAPAFAQDCRPAPLSQYANLTMTPVAGGGVSVPLTINGTTGNFMVATSGGASTITPRAGNNLGLRARYTGMTRLLDTNGYASYHYYNVKSAELGKLRGEDMIFMTTPDRSLGQDVALDGVLAADIMMYYDVEMDFAKNKLNVFSPNHCAGQVVYWQSKTVGEAPIRVAQRQLDIERQKTGGYSRSSDLRLRGQLEDQNYTVGLARANVAGADVRTVVTLDGKEFTANIDTGAAVSTLNTDTARAAYGITENSPGARALPGTTRFTSGGETVVVNGVRAFDHSFHTLSIGGITVNNPSLTVRPDTVGDHDPNNGPITGTNLTRMDDFPRPEITIGMDILSKLHLYFAFKEGKLYITPADANPAQLSMK